MKFMSEGPFKSNGDCRLTLTIAEMMVSMTRAMAEMMLLRARPMAETIEPYKSYISNCPEE